jgi:Flp pilus assembly protein TadG
VGSDMKTLRARQRGATLVLVTVGLLALLAMVGLAIDTGHITHNKARLQSTVDAAALAAAKVLDQTSGAEAPATTAALSVFGINATAHPELNQVMSNGLSITTEYSNTLSPFAPGTVPALYVRVVASEFTMWTGFTSLVGMNDVRTAASAVAGPSATIGPLSELCDVAPMVVCGDPAAAAPFYGYALNSLQVLKLASGDNTTGPIGPGNFQLIRLNGNGGSVIRTNMAGSYDSCIDGSEDVETQTGNLVGPVTQGLNTRFGEYSGGGVNITDHPPDVVTAEPNPALTYDPDTDVISQGTTPVTNSQDINFNYSTYVSRVSAENYDYQPTPNGPGASERRVLTVPIADCSGSNNGNSMLPVLGFGCYFLLQRAVQQGQENYVYGEFIDGCLGDGNPGPEPDDTFGPYRIQLYDDVGSGDS